MKPLTVREIKRRVLKFHGLDFLTDKQLDECILYDDDKNGVVVRFKATINTKNWRCIQVTTES